MKLFTFLLILSGFIQTSFLNINLVLILLILRNLIRVEVVNYYIAFFGGLLLGILGGVNIGFWPLIFVLIVKITNLIAKLPVSSANFIFLPYTILILFMVGLLEQQFLKQQLDLQKIVTEIMITPFIYIFLKLWEERFVVQKDIKLKIRK